MNGPRFSDQLEALINKKGAISLELLNDHFGEKGFAIICLLLMAIPALPLPTGGITHVFEIIVMLLALELIAGLRTIWLPKRWQKLKLPRKFKDSTLPALIRLIRKVERVSTPRLGSVLNNRQFNRLTGLFLFVFALFAFLAPPFTGLDTLPSLGAVLICLAVLLDDILVTALGLVAGATGIVLVIILGRLVLRLV